MQRRSRGLCAALALGTVASIGAQAGANPWPRARGNWFLSNGVSVDPRARAATGFGLRNDLYAEGGLGGGWFVIGSATLTPVSGQEVLLGLGRAAETGGGGARGWSLALGRRQQPGAPGQTFLRPSFAVGRGLTAGGRLGPLTLRHPGWVSAEAQVELGPGGAAPKLDLTLGVKPSDRWAVLLELWADAYPGAGPSVRLGPALVVTVGRKRLLVQTELPVLGGTTPRLKLALWSEF